MGNIVLLDDLTINKIAAGEVIERPASVVKELVENSIDAGATNINIEIKNGGISYIRITDNGKGIMPDDMEMAFERHATSKIRNASDLETVTSMGFRGEALASIAAISKVEMISKTGENEIGYKVNVQAGKIINKEETGCSKGTIITITDLFFNTPVRYKFLKKDFTEAGYIEDVITRIALIHPEIAIKLTSSGKTIIQTSGNGDIKSVVYGIYGKDVADNILEVNYQYEDIKVTGVIGKPVIARSNRGNQIFFVNKRYIKDKTLTSAAEQAFKGLLTIGKYGFLILNIEMSPSKVDVNVHPAKLEVRFQDENTIFKAVYHAIKETLLKGELVPEDKPVEIKRQETIVTPGETEIKKESIKFSDLLQKMVSKKEEKEVEDPFEYKANPIAEIYSNKYGVREEEESYKIQNKQITEETAEEDELSKMDTHVINTQEINERIMGKITELDNLKIEENSKNFEEMYAKTFGNLPKTENKEEPKDETKVKTEELEMTEKISMFDNMEDKTIPKYKFIGIAFATYIIIEIDNELYIIDQHAAHERIMYEKIKKNFYSEGEKDSQLMLLPDIINLTHKEMDIAKENIPVFEKAGFMLEQFGENTIKLTGVPNICIDLDTKQLFLETLDEINTVARTAKQEIEEKFIATLACKSAVKANMVLTKDEVDNLMKQLLVLPNPFTCPHGRPTAIHLTKNDIEKKFSRR
ncbi:MAG: DNA mismatch repair endonuclease MutL [Clostridia bacterium]|jgi:DNA mismatch repair protein MutL|nr:dNA mismatch repair protein MutL [Clostridium sp. CAG:798]HBJ12227.1 DNA mismatch repair endonuclease MutL [Clostridiales bacterium]